MSISGAADRAIIATLRLLLDAVKTVNRRRPARCLRQLLSGERSEDLPPRNTCATPCARHYAEELPGAVAANIVVVTTETPMTQEWPSKPLCLLVNLLLS